MSEVQTYSDIELPYDILKLIEEYSLKLTLAIPELFREYRNAKSHLRALTYYNNPRYNKLPLDDGDAMELLCKMGWKETEEGIEYSLNPLAEKTFCYLLYTVKKNNYSDYIHREEIKYSLYCLKYLYSNCCHISARDLDYSDLCRIEILAQCDTFCRCCTAISYSDVKVMIIKHHSDAIKILLKYDSYCSIIQSCANDLLSIVTHRLTKEDVMIFKLIYKNRKIDGRNIFPFRCEKSSSIAKAFIDILILNKAIISDEDCLVRLCNFCQLHKVDRLPELSKLLELTE